MDERIDIPADVIVENFAHQLFFLKSVLQLSLILEGDFFEHVNIVVGYFK